MGLFLGDSEPSKIFVGDTSISKVFLGDTQVRPSGGGGGQCLAYYKFATDGLDSTSNHNDCTIIGCQFGTIGGKQGVRLQQSYSSSPANYIVTPLTYTSLPVSICIWCYQTDSYGWQMLIGNPTADDKYNLRIRTGGANTVINAYGVSDTNMGNVFSLNQWVCLGVTIDQLGQGILYKDGVQVGTFSSGTNPASAGAFNFGYGTGWGDYKHPFMGWLRETAIFNTALTSGEVSDYYNSTK